MIHKSASPADLASRAKAPHMAAFGAATKHLVAGRAIHILTEA